MSEDDGTVTLTDPFSLKDADGYEWVRGNLHSHTTNSDGRAEPQERLDGYVSQGYDFLCLSDHYDITRVDSVDCPEGFVLVRDAPPFHDGFAYIVKEEHRFGVTSVGHAHTGVFHRITRQVIGDTFPENDRRLFRVESRSGELVQEGARIFRF